MRLFRAWLALFLLSGSLAFSTLDITVSGRGENSAWRVENSESGDVIGTFWSPFAGES